MNTKLLLLSFALLLGSGVAAADRRYHPLGAAYPDEERIAQEHRIDRLREYEVCSKNPNSHLCRNYGRWGYYEPKYVCCVPTYYYSDVPQENLTQTDSWEFWHNQ